MNKNIISAADADLLLHKIFSDKLLVLAFFISPSGTKLAFSGFIDSVTGKEGLVISPKPPASVNSGFFSIRLFDQSVEYIYSEASEIPKEERGQFDGAYGESVLIMRFLDRNDLLALFFTL
jgi:hypothetical protein